MPVYLQYYFWLLAVSLLCFLLERVRPWRRDQKVLRRGFGQDLFWLVFNGHYLGLLLAMVTGRLIQAINGKEVLIQGYIIPFEETGDESILILSANPFSTCFFCGGASGGGRSKGCRNGDHDSFCQSGI